MKNIHTPLTPQMKTFLARVRLNLGKLVRILPRDVLQYYIIHPQHIVSAMTLCFDTILARDERCARGVIEKYLWSTHTWVTGPEDVILNARKLAIWITRQSRGLMEEVVLYSPYDPDDRTPDEEVVARAGSLFCHALNNSSQVQIVDFPTILTGIGCPLQLSTGGDGGFFVFNLTFEPFDPRKARRLKWADAMAGIKEIEVPEVGR